MEFVIIKLLTEWNGIAEGAVLKVDKTTAKELTDAKTAEIYDEAAEQVAKEKQEADEKRMVALVKDAVKEAVKPDNADEKRIAIVHERGDDDPKAGFKNMGDFCIAAKNFKLGKQDERLTKAVLGQQESVDSDGGFLVPDEFRAELLQKTMDYAVLASRATEVPMSSESVKIPYIMESSRADGSRQGGVRGYWVAEAATITASQTALGMCRLSLNKVAALIYATDELLDDNAIAIEPLINTMAANELAFQLDDKILNGTGAGVPMGLLNAPCLISVAKEAGQAATTIVFENVMKMWSRMPARSRANAVWIINQDAEPQLMSMALVVGVGGVPVYMPASGAAGTPYSALFGRPVIPTEFSATCGSVGDIMLVDMSQYLLGRKSTGIKAATSIHVQFLTEQTAFRFSMRVDGQPWWSAPLTPYKGATNTLSPFVALAVRA